MPKRTKDHQAWLIEKLTDPQRASDYLNAAHEDSREMLLEALRDVAQARQMTKVARDAGVTRESLYRATSEIGNPTLATFNSVLRALGMKFLFTPIETGEAELPTPGSVYNIEKTAVNSASAPSDTPLLESLRSFSAGIGGSSQLIWNIGSPVGVNPGLTRAIAEQAELASVPAAFMYQATEPERISNLV